jgi:hypothetical protein
VTADLGNFQGTRNRGQKEVVDQFPTWTKSKLKSP